MSTFRFLWTAKWWIVMPLAIASIFLLAFTAHTSLWLLSGIVVGGASGMVVRRMVRQ